MSLHLHDDSKTTPKSSNQLTEYEAMIIVICVVVYVIVGLYTNYYLLFCALKKESPGLLFLRGVISAFWPVFWVYVLIKKIKNKNWEFCTKSIKKVKSIMFSKRKPFKYFECLMTIFSPKS